MNAPSGSESYLDALRAELSRFEGASLVVDTMRGALTLRVAFGTRSVSVTKDRVALEQLSASTKLLAAIAAIDARELLFQVGAPVFPKSHSHRNGRGTKEFQARQVEPFVWRIVEGTARWGVVIVEHDESHGFSAKIARDGAEAHRHLLDDRAPMLTTAQSLLDAISRAIGSYAPHARVTFSNP